MRILFINFILFIIVNDSYTMIIKDPQEPSKEEKKILLYDVIPPYNPYSIYVPSTNILKQLSPDRILDMGASAYGLSFTTRAIYFYTNVIALFPNDTKSVAWATYESGYIYYRRRQYKKALEYFSKVLEMKGNPIATEALAKVMVNRLKNSKEYKIFLKQEDIIFLQDKKAKSILDKQISKERDIAEKARKVMAKGRKKREKEEARRIKQENKMAEKNTKQKINLSKG